MNTTHSSLALDERGPSLELRGIEAAATAFEQSNPDLGEYVRLQLAIAAYLSAVPAMNTSQGGWINVYHSGLIQGIFETREKATENAYNWDESLKATVPIGVTIEPAEGAAPDYAALLRDDLVNERRVTKIQYEARVKAEACARQMEEALPTINYLLDCLEVHADKFPVPDHIRTNVSVVRAAFSDSPAPAKPRPIVSVKTMHKSGDEADYFVSIKVGDRDATPHVFTERYKAEYHVAFYDWVLNGGEKPALMAFRPDEWPVRETPVEAVPAPAKPEGAANAELVAALSWYANEARGAAMAMKDGKPSPNAALAVLTVLALDGGKRAKAALSAPSPQGREGA